MDERLDARISANGHSRFVRDVRVEHVLAAMDEVEKKLASGNLTQGIVRGT